MNTFTRPTITEKEITQINQLIASNPTWRRSRLSIELCHIWYWYDQVGKPKDISCRTLLRELDVKGIIALPISHHKTRQTGSKDVIRTILHETADITCDIKDVLPIRIDVVKERTHQGHEYKYLIDQYHYLGFDMTIGENIKYMVYSRDNKLLACLLFAASAWGVRPEINISAGTPLPGKQTSSSQPTTPDFWCCPGFGFRIWPVTSLVKSHAELHPTGS